jgi:hypothetical protein
MTYIPFENKVSLINKYIQINILQNKGKKEHVDIPENEIYAAIIDDLKAHNDSVTQPPKDSLIPVINSLKVYQEKQNDMRFQLNALMHTLETVRDEESMQIGLDDIINNLAEMEKS